MTHNARSTSVGPQSVDHRALLAHRGNLVRAYGDNAADLATAFAAADLRRIEVEAQLAALERAAIPALLWIEGMKSGLQSCEEAARSSGQNIEQHSSFCTMEQDARSLKEALAALSTSPDKEDA